ncbi:hypothetical protein [Limobrevibacterium gyesilva]|uniref:Uncharacterized protein n=1 Tax=Limobrevibacterium gyesilva TaxID=2991712 RepID=A0AA42CJQ6_9PROT|nr:hypothetical protein [Limobrevibacterium gyesilva]MCW3477137.1 hypothetical protein [Limobrevibacterium gyesilva]
MDRIPKPPAGAGHRQSDHHKRQEERLDRALDDTSPASDPPAITNPSRSVVKVPHPKSGGAKSQRHQGRV